MGADSAGGSASIFDSDPLGDDEYLDNLSISVDNIYAILDEEPLPPQGNNIFGNSEGFHQGELAPGQVDHVKDFKPKAEPSPVLEDFRGENSQWNLETSDFKREMECDFLPQVDFNNFSDNGSFLGSQHFDSKSFRPLPLQHSSDWLRLSCSNNSVLTGAFGQCSESFFTSNFDHQQMLNNISNCSIQNAKAVGLTSTYNDFYSIDEKEKKKDQEQLQGEIYFKSEKEPKPDISHLSPVYNLQNGGIGSSHCVPTKNSILSDGLPSSNAGALPLSMVENGNLYPSCSMYSHINTGKHLTDLVHLEANTSQLTNRTCAGRNNLILPGNVAFGIGQMKSTHFHPIVASGYRSTDTGGNELLPQNSCRASEVKLEDAQVGSPNNSFAEVSFTDFNTSLPDDLCSDQNYFSDTSLISESSTDSSPIPSGRNFGSCSVDRSAVITSEKLLSDPKIFFASKNPKVEIRNKREDQLTARCHKLPDVYKGDNPAVHWNPMGGNLRKENDFDVCILDDISDLVILSRPPAHRTLQPNTQFSGFSKHHYPMGGRRLKPDDERLSFQIALQDLSQPISEASPPDGVLTVPLLRHQRIALSWMVHKETASLRCCGGILADDQGLGKTISTIALILTERSSSSNSCSVLEEKDGCEPLNLDDDDYNNHNDVSVMKKSWNSMPNVTSRPIKKENTVKVVKGRPQAGTLVVCPTSVLRQWAEELQNKVSSKANLSFLVYHGGNRTKNPNELAKYDVVLTTYAIISMEVPKQPLVDKGDEDGGKQDASCVPNGLSNSKKRKVSNSKSRNSMTLESSVRPLGRVRWFRVVLDEAQSIKNHRTQAARACWGLRAKRRWCLSGTPIQNAIDDLYSYFRFLRFEPFEEYHSFCSLKGLINKDPQNGYKKLQAILKMIMLRRTKGTLLDGKPIINLPPKTVSLKKVKFSNEEQTFYAMLEAESQEQFKEYADAGTVKQNYVNILLMLLRLRQACNHRLLVRGCNSISSQNSSLETSKKLPRDKKIDLLSCLEASLAICTICNDVPEDSVVTICGHVFCNQCICEHLTGDENTCPSLNCKVQLSVASVFSRGTLKSSLSDQSGHDSYSDNPGPEMKDKYNMCEDCPSYPLSSKIKVALEILQSLPKAECSSKTNIEECSGFQDTSANSVKAESLRTSEDSSGISAMNIDKCSGSRVSEKAIVFSQWTGMLDLLEAPLRSSSIQYRRLDGTMSVVARERAVKDFNTLPEVTVIIMSLKAASLGLNMVAACHVLLLDLWWNPTTEDQAVDRAHRIGQIRPVTVSRLTVENTVEDRILGLQEKKREMVASAFGEDDSGTRQARLTEEDLRYLFMV